MRKFYCIYKKKLLLLTVAIVSSLNTNADSIVKIDNNNSTSYSIVDISRIDLMDSNNIKLIGKDGSVLLSGLNTNDFKLDFTQEDVNAIKETKENARTSSKCVKKYIKDNRLLISTDKGNVYTITGVRIN